MDDRTRRMMIAKNNQVDEANAAAASAGAAAQPPPDAGPPPTEEELYDSAFDMDAETFNRAIESGELQLGVDLAADDGSDHDPDDGVVRPPSPQHKTGRTIVIKHNGAEHILDEGRTIEFAQKGFDYDQKVGPHQRIARLLDQDPQAQQLMNDYFMRKFGGGVTTPAYPDINNPNAAAPTYQPVPAPAPAPTPPPTPTVDLTGFKPSKISDFNTEGEWLADNLQRALAVVNSRPTQPVHQPAPTHQPQPTGTPMNPAQAAMQVAGVLHNYDPDNARLVLPHIDAFAAGLTVAEYRRYTSSLPNFFEFYDMVKGEVLAGRVPNPLANQPVQPGQPVQPQPRPASPPPQGRQPVPQPRRFTLKPGGGTPPTNQPGRKINVWDMSNEDFDKFVSSKM